MTEIGLIERHIQNWVEKKRPPVEFREQVDLKYSFEKYTLIIYESRKPMEETTGRVKSECAKARYIKATNKWKIYWKRANLKWYLYEPEAEVNSIHDVLQVIENDNYGCFFG